MRIMKKIIVGCVCALISAGLLMGCQSFNGEISAGPSADVQPFLPSSPTPGVTEEPQPATLSSAMLETSGGIVIVGDMKPAGNGEWCIALDEPITVTLTHGEYDPDVYNNVSRIMLFDASVDDIDKSAYEDMGVTAKGVLESSQDNTMLYLHVCYIEAERSDEGTHADESIDRSYTGQWVGDYDPSKPLPEKLLPSFTEGICTFNPYALNINTVKYFGNEYADFFIGFVDAFMNYETSCPIVNEQYGYQFVQMLLADFPLFEADGVVYDGICCDEATGTVNWSYSVSREEHEAIIAAFADTINGYLSKVKEGDNDIVAAEKLYRGIAKSLTYDEEKQKNRSELSAYFGFRDKTGICVTFANCYSYLLTQAGIDNQIVNSGIQPDETGDENGHAWNLVTLGGENYFCDPTYENSTTGGNDFLYFGMTMEDRMNDSTKWLADTMYAGIYKIKTMDEIELSKTRLNTIPIDTD